MNSEHKFSPNLYGSRQQLMHQGHPGYDPYFAEGGDTTSLTFTEESDISPMSSTLNSQTHSHVSGMNADAISASSFSPSFPDSGTGGPHYSGNSITPSSARMISHLSAESPSVISPSSAVSPAIPSVSTACSSSASSPSGNTEEQNAGVSSTTTATGVKGNGAPVVKDEAYYEKRRKNNESAKRSRDSRARKAQEVLFRFQCEKHINQNLVKDVDDFLKKIHYKEIEIFRRPICSLEQDLGESNEQLRHYLRQKLEELTATDLSSNS
ncbi:uncharacterized protein LOC143285019 [Babylonia areolata]|uniref:uncharacterized protein LOC143285019 n=1 Tax=Babylonia areolata TaxID=304850 RepID=UPI003FD07C76